VGLFEKCANPQGLKPLDIAGLNVRDKARTLQSEPPRLFRTLQNGTATGCLDRDQFFGGSGLT